MVNAPVTGDGRTGAPPLHLAVKIRRLVPYRGWVFDRLTPADLRGSILMSMTSNSDKHREFRVSFAEILVNFSSDGLVLLPPSDLRSRRQTNVGAKQLADHCHIYMVLQRPGLSFVPGQVYDSGYAVYGKLKLTAGGRIDVTDFKIPHGAESLNWRVSECPHRTIVGESAFYSHNEILPA